MDIITRVTAAAGVTKRFKEQYAHYPEERVLWSGRTKAKTIEKLAALGDNPDPDQVDEVIGNTSWTDPGTCNECGNDDRGPRMVIGEEADYESKTAWLCFACIETAHLMIQGPSS